MQPTPTGSGLAPDPSTGIGGELSADIQQLGSSASDRIHTEIDARKGTAASQAQSLSSAIARTADGLDEGAPQWLKSAFQKGAQRTQHVADMLEQKDSRTIIREIQTLARDNPGAFLAGCTALGFAAARVYKAGAPGNSASSAPQFPPLQVDEPFRPSSEHARSANRAGEFA